MAISGKRIILANDQALRAKDQSGNVVELLKINSSGALAGQVADELADKALASDVTTLQSKMDTAESEIDQLQLDMTDKASLADVTSLEGRVLTTEGDIISLQSDVSTLNGDSSVSGSVDFKVAAEAVLRESGDTATLAAANAYTDSKAVIVSIAQIVHVAKDGIDVSADGSISKPFLTISAALSAITDASPSKRYAIKVAPGSYTETSLEVKANVFIIGEQKETVRISGPVSMGAWAQDNAGSDDRAGVSMVTLLGAANFDWSVARSRAGKLYMNEVVFASTLNLYGYDNAIAQAQFDSCVIFGNVTISGVNVGVFSNNVCFGNITLNQHPNGGMASILSASGGYCSGTLTQTTTVDDFNRRCSSFLRGFGSENLIVDGPSSYADVDLNSQGKSSTQKLNGGQIIALTPRISHDLETQMIKPLANNAHNMGDWGKQFMFNFAYVHASSGTELYLASVDSAYDAAGSSAGYGIFIEADSYGLKPDVSGGDINLKTSTVSGTGVRGKIKLDSREVDLSSAKIVSLADGVDSQDAVTKSQLDSGLADKAAQIDLDALGIRVDSSESDIIQLQTDVSAKLDSSLKGAADGVAELDATGKVPASQLPTINSVVAVKMAAITLTAQQVTDGYLDLTHDALSGSISVFCERVAILEDFDYTVSSVGGVSRLTWIGPSAAGAEEEFAEGDIVYIQYLRQA